MKRNFNISKSDSAFYLVSIAVLIAVSLLMIIYTNKVNKEIIRLKSKDKDNLAEIEYMKFAFKNILDFDTCNADFKQKNKIELGLYLTDQACDKCNKKWLQLLRCNISPEDFCVYYKFNDERHLTEYNLKNINIQTLQKNDILFKSSGPAFFITINDQRIMKFIPNNDFPEFNHIYFNMITNKFKGIQLK